ncbi:MAG: GNAT family N-acetyltransferase [Acidimicrobiales bacterium]
MSASTSVCRRCNDDDFAELASLRYEWRAGDLGERGLDATVFEREMIEWMTQRRSTHQGYLAARDGATVGCAWLCVVDRVPAPAEFVRRAGIIQSVYVRSSFRNVGIGTDLVRFIIDEARDMQLSYLGLHPSERSVPFYRRLGFAAYEGALELRF